MQAVHTRDDKDQVDRVAFMGRPLRSGGSPVIDDVLASVAAVCPLDISRRDNTHGVSAVVHLHLVGTSSARDCNHTSILPRRKLPQKPGLLEPTQRRYFALDSQALAVIGIECPNTSAILSCYRP